MQTSWNSITANGERRTETMKAKSKMVSGMRASGLGLGDATQGGCEVETEKNNHKAARKQSKAEEAQAQAKSQNGKGTAPPNANWSGAAVGAQAKEQ